MHAQLEMAALVAERHARTGRVGFAGIEYQLAKRGVDVMDQLAERVDRATAIAAAEWSEAKVNAMCERHGSANVRAKPPEGLA